MSNHSASCWTSLPTLQLQSHFAQLPGHLYTRMEPTPLPDPRLVSANVKVAEQLGIDPCSLQPDLLASLMGGHELPEQAAPLAMKYAGHQFGVYNPQLGDGRGLLLGELAVPQADGSEQLWDLHLKGAGQTPYSRMGDGRAVLRSSLREYLIGEALTYLNIPSTRALALCVNSQQVVRERLEPGATIIRVSRSHVRFGHFEHLYYSRQHDDLKVLADYCLERWYPQCRDAEKPYLAMFKAISQASAHTVAGWIAYGFLHGVMNTDNMSILGETFDHGPFAFIDRWKENAVYNHTDREGRYAFDKQPDVMHWNLSALAQALTPIIDVEDLKAELENFPDYYQQAYLKRMRERLGLAFEDEGDSELLRRWRALLNMNEVDFNPLYRALAEGQSEQDGQPVIDRAALQAFRDQLGEPSQSLWLDSWLKDYEARLTLESRNAAKRQAAMLAVNPVYILRTRVTDQLISEAEKGNFQPVQDWLQVLQNPFEQHHGIADELRWAPDSKQLTMLSCSS
ncbi:protein adenylyltransferase SelO [Oceanobacter kriegii]|uniref:protein adenylyltransferase SelO n=1 Tax=Oceanobacter kriegii TaxID=64972 RepID=UPI0004194F6D|nr:YdiU family protein [Oceanobacter kriegii]